MCRGCVCRRSFVQLAVTTGAWALVGSRAEALDARTFDDEQRDFGLQTAAALKDAPYEGPTPLRVSGIETVTTNELKAMIDAATPPIVVDVRLAPDSCRGIPGARCDEAIQSLPTSLWLPGAGLAGGNDFQQKFADRIAQYTCGDRQAPIVFFGSSKSDWLPVNASLRSAAIGYRRIFWYRGGRSAWRTAGYPTTPAHLIGTLEPIQVPLSTFCEEATDYGVQPSAIIRTAVLEAPTPTSVLGAKTVSTTDLWDMMLSSQPPVLVDVVGGSQTMTLPGAHWLPGAGRGTGLEDDLQPVFTAELDRLTCGNKSTPLVIFCQSKTCWLSANATLRAVSLGYHQIYWYRGGRCAWQQGQLPSGPVDLIDRRRRRCCGNNG